MRSAPSNSATLRYVLNPDGRARAAIDETVQAYADMAALLAGLPAETGSNLVTLHERAYELVRERTHLPARLVTLGLRDFTAHHHADRGLPLDDKLFSIKGPSTLTIATVSGRVAVPYDVAGYAPGWEALFPARLVVKDGLYEIHVGVEPRPTQMEDVAMIHEGVLARMGRLIAGVANAAIDRVEDANKVAVVEQAIREIDQAAEQARADLGKAKAEEFRISSRRSEIGRELAGLEEKIRLALGENREDLAKAAIARQIDLEAQVTALDKALADVRDQIAEGQQAMQAVLATRREAEARLADLKKSLARLESEQASGAARKPASDGAARAASTISRVTGVPGGAAGSSPALDELDRLHRERAIEERLARFKSDG